MSLSENVPLLNGVEYFDEEIGPESETCLRRDKVVEPHESAAEPFALVLVQFSKHKLHYRHVVALHCRSAGTLGVIKVSRQSSKLTR